MQRFITIAIALGIVLSALSCSKEQSQRQSKEDVLRELYWITKAEGSLKEGHGKDTMSFASFKAQMGTSSVSPDTLRNFLKNQRLVLSASLNRLGYGSGQFTWKLGEREKEGLRRFQGDIGIPVTGAYDSLTIHHIMEASLSLEIDQVILPTFTFLYSGENLFAGGTWKALDDTLGLPIYGVVIQCQKALRECLIAKCDFMGDNLQHLVPKIDTYDITYWTDQRIVAVGNPWSEKGCQQTITFDIPGKVVLFTETCPAFEFAGTKFPARTMILKLVNGSSVGKGTEILTEVREEAYKKHEFYTSLIRKNLLRIEPE